MQDYQRDFLRFALDQGVLRFGDFTLKSGRHSPYFFNAGLFNSGAALARLGRFYAAALQASDLACDVLYGPAYKGIPWRRRRPSPWRISTGAMSPMPSIARSPRTMARAASSSGIPCGARS